MRGITFARVLLVRSLASPALRRLSSAAPSPPPPQHNIAVDVCIVGGGIVGSCVAAALKRAPRTSWPQRLDDACTPSPQQHAPRAEAAVARDVRVYAISPASRQLLQAVGAWELLQDNCVHNYDSMQVWQARGAAVLNLKAGDVGAESLGSIVGHSSLQAALKRVVLDTDTVCIAADVRSISSLPQAAAAAAGHVVSAGAFSISCSLLVGADGASSRVRAHSGIASAAMQYSSHAVVAVLKLSGSTTTAHQRFLPTGPIAMLPLDAGWASLVWTLPAQQAAQMALLPSAELASHVNAAFRAGHEGTAVLPPLVTGIEGKAVAVPLQLMQACGMQDGSVVLVGDAAHAVHPLAGQGLNLGLQDALSLVAHMCRAQAAGGAADDFVALQAYERERLPANAAWGAAIHFIGSSFAIQESAVAVPRGLVMSLLNSAAPLKQQIILAASGEGGNHLQNLEELK